MKPKHFSLSVIFVLIVVALFSQTPLQAQRTPQQLATTLQQMQLRLEKYDYDVQMDSFYHECQKQIRICDKKIEKNNPALYAERAIWRVILANTELDYRDVEGYRISNRTAGSDADETDWLTWDYDRLSADIVQNYLLALQDARRSQAQSKPYQPLIDPYLYCPLLSVTTAYPTLYDLVASDFIGRHNPIIYGTDRDHLEQYLSDDFPNIALDTSDTLSVTYQKLRLFQELLRFHANDTDKTALLVWKLKLHQSILTTSDDHNTSSLQEQYLKRLEERFGQEDFAWILFLELGNLYATKDSEPQDSNRYCKAVHYYQLVQEATATSNPAVAKDMKGKISYIQKPSASAIPPSDLLLPTDNLICLTSRNCDSVFLYVKPYLSSEIKANKFSEYNAVYKSVVPISTKHLYLTDTILLSIPPLPYGRYIVLASPLPLSSPSLKNVDFTYHGFRVSSLMVLYHEDKMLHDDDESQMEVYVMDRENGQPVADAKISVKKDNKMVPAGQTDANGHATLTHLPPYVTFTVSKGKDKIEDIRAYPTWTRPDKPNYNVYSYLDRAIYRPGQTVHWKAVVVKESEHTSEIVADETVEAILLDGNGQKLQTLTVTTNTFGSAAGEFDLPSTGFLGNYHIDFLIKDKACGSKYFKVEEYKRPTYEVVMEQPAESFRTGEQIHVTGKATAYAGYPVQDATVTYRIGRNVTFPFQSRGWWLNPWYDYYIFNRSTTIANGTCTTDEEGNFHISFLAEPEGDYSSYWPLLKYTISVTVTDKSGETHTQKLSVNVCDRAIRFETGIPEIVTTDLGVPSFPVKAVNMNEKPQPAIVSYRVVRLEMPENFIVPAPFKSPRADSALASQFPQYAFFGEEHPESWKEVATIKRGVLTLPADSLLVLPELQQQPVGAYKIILTATDPFGSIVEEEYVFYTNRSNSKTFAVFTPLKVQSSTPSAEVGETIHFTIGSYINDASVLVHIFSNDQLIEEKWIHLNQSSATLSYTVQPGQQGVYTCQAHLCHNGTLYTTEETVKVPFSDKKIDVEFVTFRDKLQPGETATVKVRLKDEFHRPLKQAELLCTMYDASLDIFSRNTYSSHFHNTTYNTPWKYSYLSPWKYRIDCLISTRRSECSLPTFFWRYLPEREYVLEEVCLRMDMEMDMETYELKPNIRSSSGVGFGSNDGAAAPQEAEPVSEAPRSNFAETAFFFPFLQTNDKGEIEMEFTLPESLTRWKMLGMSHTQDLRTGTFEKLLVTQKPVMVVPNAPRFLYEGDRFVLSSKIVNTSELSLQGEVDVQFSDPVTGAILSSRSQTLTLAAGSTSTVDYSVDIPMGLSAVAYCVTARLSNGSTTYSDGETNTLPVLSRRQLVTETVPFFITHQGRKTFSLERLRQNSNNLVSCKMQFTPTPQWNVVLALPYLTQYPYDCHEQLFSKLYANALSAHILRTHPNLKTLLNDCRQNHPEALDSKLRQNEELMQVLLSETPWVMEAQQEEQDIQDIFCLFDEEQVKRESAEMVRKIENGQNADGGWPWFAGGKSSSYITEHLLIGTGRLVKQGICQYGNAFLKSSSIQKAITFIDNDIEKDYQYQKKHWPKFKEEYTLGSDILHYLYARSFYPKTSNNRESYQFYKQHLLKEAATLPTFYQKTLAALTLYQWGTAESKALAKSIMLNIKENAQQSEEMGMFWKKEGYGYYWDDALIERQALMMEAFQTILGDEESVKQMEIWLLQQRRGNHWSTTRATADACYAVFCVGKEEHAVPASITLKICGETRNYADTLQIPVKEDVQGCLDHPEAGDIVLTTTRDGLSYGGVFYQYYADIDSITTSGTDIPLSVERKLYRVESGDKGERLASITEERPLRVGDKVRVRMEIRCDRDLEFVHLKDLRAAAFEPSDGMVSGYRWQDGLGYYQSFRDASVNFFFDQIRRGTYVFEYTLYVTQSGEFSSGYASIQCMYAPEFCAHSANSGKLVIGK